MHASVPVAPALEPVPRRCERLAAERAAREVAERGRRADSEPARRLDARPRVAAADRGEPIARDGVGLARAPGEQRRQRRERGGGGVPGEPGGAGERVAEAHDDAAVAARAPRIALEDATGEIAEAGHRSVPAKRLAAVSG